MSNFGGSAWTLHEPTGEYYLAQFLPTQPDLNWWNDEVRERFDDILRFWFARGVAGFRIDVCHAIVKDRELRDDPPVTPDDHRELQHRSGQARLLGQPPRGARRPAALAQRGRRARGPDGDTPILVGETYVLELDELMPFYGTGRDELHLAFNFLFVHADLDAAADARRSSRASRPACRPTPGRSTPAPTTTPAGWRPAGRRTTSGAPARRC